MNSMETTTTIAGTVVASAASHILCCGILPFAVNSSMQAAAGYMGLQLGLAMLTIMLVATLVTFWEKHRHEHVCTNQARCRFNMGRHLSRNMVVGAIAYGFFSLVTRVPSVHYALEHLFGSHNHLV